MSMGAKQGDSVSLVPQTSFGRRYRSHRRRNRYISELRSIPRCGQGGRPPTGSVRAVGNRRREQADSRRVGVLPGFDVVRINPSGDAVIAGRAEPGATVTLRDGRSALGQVIADGRGEWVFVPEKPLQPGAHRLDLEMRMGDGATHSLHGRSADRGSLRQARMSPGSGRGRHTTARSPRSSRGRADDRIAEAGVRCW